MTAEKPRATHPDPEARAASERWKELDAGEAPEPTRAGNHGFFERLGKLLHLHPRGPHGT